MLYEDGNRIRLADCFERDNELIFGSIWEEEFIEDLKQFIRRTFFC